MKKAVIYCRKSEDSLLPTDVRFEDQEAICRKYADENGLEVVKAYRESHTGADLEYRPLIWQALADIQRGDAQVLLVRNRDRLARDMNHAAVITYNVQKNHGEVIAVLEPYDDKDPNQVMGQGFKDLFAQYERLVIGVRTANGRRGRVERGGVMPSGSPLFGYNWEDNEVGQRTTYIVDDISGPIVQRIFQEVANGRSLHSLCDQFNAEGVPTPSQHNFNRGHGIAKPGKAGRPVGKGWLAPMMSRLLKTRAYTGTLTAYQWDTKRGKTGKKMPVARAENDPKLFRQAVPQLVDQTLWDAAQAASKSRLTVGRPPTDPEALWLRGHVICFTCGHIMSPSRHFRDRVYEYRCTRRPGEVMDPCEAAPVNIRASMLDAGAYGSLVKVLTQWERMEALMIERLGMGKQSALQAITDGIQAQLEDKQAEIDNALELARQTSNKAISARLLQDAEKVQASVDKLETQYVEAKAKLDTFNAGNAWVRATMGRIKSHLVDGRPPTIDEVKAFPLEERRVLLTACGLTALVKPADGKKDRVMWGIDLEVLTSEELGNFVENLRQRYVTEGTPEDIKLWNEGAPEELKISSRTIRSSYR